MDYTTVGNYGAEDAMLAIIGIFYLVFFTIILITSIISIIGMWKMFTKAKEEGWKAIIPVYNMYTLCKIIGVSPWWLLIVFGSALLGIIPFVGYIVEMAALIYFGILLSVSTANSFGKDTGFAIGIYFLAPVFYCILGFGKAEYIGPKPMKDIIFNNAQ